MLRSWMERLGRATIGLPRLPQRLEIDRAGTEVPFRPAPQSRTPNAPATSMARGIVVPMDNFS